MILPNLIGVTPMEAKQILAEDYPEIAVTFQTYLSPKKRQKRRYIDLIIRQRIIESNILELTISPFPLMNE